MILLLQPDRAQLAALDELVAQQQDSRSSHPVQPPGSPATADGIDLAAPYAVTHNVASRLKIYAWRTIATCTFQLTI